VRVGLSPTSNTPAALQIYTGTVVFQLISQTHEQSVPIFSFVPLDPNFNLQEYTVPPAAITVVGSLTSLGVDDTSYVGAIDTVTADVETNHFSGAIGSRKVLLLNGTAVALRGGVGRFAYQVTVLTDLSTLPNGLTPHVFKAPSDEFPNRFS
jgi:hypothetical protein